MQPEQQSRLADMLLSARYIKEFAADLTFEAFVADRMPQSAIIRELEIIGEAARNVDAETRSAHPEIPWTKIAGLRNRITHEYFRLDFETIWQIVQREIDPLINALTPLVPPEE